jgi:ribosomal protein L11 methyltransferase
MDVRAFRVSVPESAEDEAAGALWELGTLGVEVLRAAEGRALLLAYFEERPGLPASLEQALGPLEARVEATPVPEVDWVARFRETFRGFTVGRFHVAPAWDVPERLAPGACLIRVDPGRAFGTGTHETTRLCLAEIEALHARRTPDRVLDVGTGTGILAIASARLGAALVAGVDNDAEALVSAREHARLNGVSLSLVHGDAGAALRPGLFDLVLANITAPLLRANAASLAALVAPGGTLVLSGLLSNEAPSVAEAYAALGTPRERLDGEWSALTFTAP